MKYPGAPPADPPYGSYFLLWCAGSAELFTKLGCPWCAIVHGTDRFRARELFWGDGIPRTFPKNTHFQCFFMVFDVFLMSLGLGDAKPHMGSYFYPGARSGGKPMQSGLAKFIQLFEKLFSLGGRGARPGRVPLMKVKGPRCMPVVLGYCDSPAYIRC